MKKWLLIYCKPRHDSVAAVNLQRQGFTVYSPTIAVAQLEPGAGARLRTEPLFPGYVFIHVDAQVQSIAPVRSTKGVLRFVRFGAEYATAAQETIDQIERNAAEHCGRAARCCALQRGDRVKVNGSGFHDIDAIFCNPCGAERALLLLSLLGREAEVSVPMQFVSLAEDRYAFDRAV